MKAYRRVFVTVGLAATLPVLAFSAVQISFSLRDRAAAVEQEAVARVDRVVTDVEARLQGEFLALRILAGASSFERDDWRAFYERVARARAENPDWVTLALYDVMSRHWIFDLRWSAGTEILPDAAPPPPAKALQGQPAAGVAQRLPAPPPVAVAWIYLPVRRQGEVQLILALALDSAAFQEILLSDVPDSVVAATVDADGRFVARTIGYEERAGTPATRFVREAMARAQSGFYRGRTYEGLENYTAYRTSASSGWSTHVAVASRLIDRPTRWSTTAAWLATLGALAIVAALGRHVVRDLAERRDAERTMLQSQKMEAVGRLTGGIAHDFNNLLTAIIGNLGLLRRRLTDRPELERLASHALEAAERAAKLSSQLLAFSRTQRLQLQAVDVADLLTGMHDLLEQTLGPSIDLAIDIDAAARTVVCDRNQLELALLNLVVNSRDAMPAGGRVEIKTRVADPSERKDLAPGDYVVIMVADTGSGMTEAVRARALEPFFTTKPLGKGTGLGLAQVYGIIGETGGTIRIESAPGQGTRIQIVLPAARGDAVVPVATRSPDHNLQAVHPERAAAILAVDDDAGVRAFLVEALQAAGHHVFEAATADAALELLHQRRFDLIIVDYLMPQRTGAELVRIVHERWPELRVLMISGYHDSAAVAAEAGEIRVLRKPFDPIELIRNVQSLLDGR